MLNKLSTKLSTRLRNLWKGTHDTPSLRLKLSTLLTGMLPLKRDHEPLRVSSMRLLLGFGAGYCLAALMYQTDLPKPLPHKSEAFNAKHYVLDTLSFKQFTCAYQLFTRESNWRVNAKNGSHYGIPQGKSEWLKTASAKQQIDWSYSYVTNRYGSIYGEPNYCAALKHLKRVGWH